LTLPVQVLEKIKSVFNECYKDLFNKAESRLRRTSRIKLKAIDFCKKNNIGGHGGD